MKISEKITLAGIIASVVLSGTAVGVSAYTLYRSELLEIKDASIQRVAAVPNIVADGYDYKFVVVNSGNRNLTVLSCLVSYGRPKEPLQFLSPPMDPVSVAPYSSAMVYVLLPKKPKFAKNTSFPEQKRSWIGMRFHAIWPDGERVKADIHSDSVDWKNMFNVQFKNGAIRFVKNTEL